MQFQELEHWMEIVKKKNLRQFLFYYGTLIANPKDVKEEELEDNVLVVYTQKAYTIEKDDLEDLAFFDKEDGDTLFLVPKANL